jgi:hypothetical protein
MQNEYQESKNANLTGIISGNLKKKKKKNSVVNSDPHRFALILVRLEPDPEPEPAE